MTTDIKHEPDEYDLDDEQRCQFLAVLACHDGVLESMSESGARDVTPMTIRASAIELRKSSVELMRAREELADARIALEAFEALAAGYMGFEEYEPGEGEDPEGVEIKTMSGTSASTSERGHWHDRPSRDRLRSAELAIPDRNVRGHQSRRGVR